MFRDETIVVKNETVAYSTELMERQAKINNLLSQLDDKIVYRQRSDDLKDSVTDLIDQISGNVTGIQGDLVSLLSSFKSGLITSDELEKMILQERVRSNFLMSESMGMSTQMKYMCSQFEKLVDRIDATDLVASAGIDHMHSNIFVVMEAIDILATVIAAPGDEITAVVKAANKLVPKSFDDDPRMQTPKDFQRRNISAIIEIVEEVIPEPIPILIPEVKRRISAAPTHPVTKPGLIRLDSLPTAPAVVKKSTGIQTDLSGADVAAALAPRPITPVTVRSRTPSLTPDPAAERKRNSVSSGGERKHSINYAEASDGADDKKPGSAKTPKRPDQVAKRKSSMAAPKSANAAKKRDKEVKKDVAGAVGIEVSEVAQQRSLSAGSHRSADAEPFPPSLQIPPLQLKALPAPEPVLIPVAVEVVETDPGPILVPVPVVAPEIIPIKADPVIVEEG